MAGPADCRRSRGTYVRHNISLSGAPGIRHELGLDDRQPFSAQRTLYSSRDVYAAQGCDPGALVSARGCCTTADRAPSARSRGDRPDHSAVSQLADRLSRDGWLRAVVDRADRRLRRLTLTAKADAALRDAKPIWRAIQDVLDTHCRAAGIDVLGTLGAFSAVLEAPLADEIARRALALRADAVQVVPFRSELREHFYRLNATGCDAILMEEIDIVCCRPEDEILVPARTLRAVGRQLWSEMRLNRRTGVRMRSGARSTSRAGHGGVDRRDDRRVLRRNGRRFFRDKSR